MESEEKARRVSEDPNKIVANELKQELLSHTK
jgi:hypothetical protein